jgi:bifunctional ADP-heptose synthase (sugar kinase/adenylyltransferase)
VCGVSMGIPLELKDGTERLTEQRWSYTEEEQLEQLLNGQICMIAFPSSADMTGSRRIILSGSFNPLHDGHVKLLEVACRFL